MRAEIDVGVSVKYALNFRFHLRQYYALPRSLYHACSDVYLLLSEILILGYMSLKLRGTSKFLCFNLVLPKNGSCYLYS